MSIFPTSAIEDFPIGNILLRDHHAATTIVGFAPRFFEPATFAVLAGTNSGW